MVPVHSQKCRFCSLWPLPSPTDPGVHQPLHVYHPMRPLEHVCNRPHLCPTLLLMFLLPRSPSSWAILEQSQTTRKLVILLTSQVSGLRTVLWRVFKVTKKHLIDSADYVRLVLPKSPKLRVTLTKLHFGSSFT